MYTSNTSVDIETPIWLLWESNHVLVLNKSVEDPAHWFGIDQSSACVCRETLIADCAHWFCVNRLDACVSGETLIADCAHWFGVD